MKLTIINKYPDNWHSQELLKSAKKVGFQASIEDIEPSDIPDKMADKLGDIVIWRNSSLDNLSERTALRGYLKNKIVVNDSLFRLPTAAHKYFQQKYLKSYKATAKWSIPTYRIKDIAGLKEQIAKGRLEYPFIAKPNFGAEGRDVLLIRSSKDFANIKNPRDSIFQNFIPNDGDWRVIVVGGTPLGAMKRIAAKGSHLNNISQGATAVLETDDSTLEQVYKMATKAASTFRLTFCGVDIIQNRQTGQYHILELNTVPAWDEQFGFQSITGINVPDQVMKWAAERVALAGQKLPTAIEEYYKNRIAIHFYESFHFASRLWLWTGDAWARNLLNKHEAELIGCDDKATEEIVKTRLQKGGPALVVNQYVPHRHTSFKKYPMLPAYNALLFKALMAETVYGRDIRPILRKHITDDDLLGLFLRLSKDDDAVRLLSTHAINYFYLLKNYFRDQPTKLKAVEFDPGKLIGLLPGYKKLETRGIITPLISIKLQVLLLTHAVIGQSYFYAVPVTEAVYNQLCAELEKLIKNNYFNTSLDNKFEFLVCAALCGYQTGLADLINQEAEQSVSWAGNFLIEPARVDESLAQHCLRSSEHRNTLYSMSQKPFKQASKSTKSGKKIEIGLTKTIGSFEKVSFPDFNLFDVIAKIDTGATTGSLHASEIREVKLPTGKKALRFLPYGNRPAVIVKSFKFKQIRSSNGETSMRYVIPTTIVFDGVQYPIRLTLADRTPMKKGILIGRRFLRHHGFVVDVKKGTKYRGEIKPL